MDGTSAKLPAPVDTALTNAAKAVLPQQHLHPLRLPIGQPSHLRQHLHPLGLLAASGDTPPNHSSQPTPMLPRNLPSTAPPAVSCPSAKQTHLPPPGRHLRLSNLQNTGNCENLTSIISRPERELSKPHRIPYASSAPSVCNSRSGNCTLSAPRTRVNLSSAPSFLKLAYTMTLDSYSTNSSSS